MLLEPQDTRMLAYRVNWENCDPGDMVTITGRLCFPDAIGSSGVSVQAYATVGWEGVLDCQNSTDAYITQWKLDREIAITDCLIESYLSTIGMSWPSTGSNGPYTQKLSSQILDVSSANPYCSNCNCSGESESE